MRILLIEDNEADARLLHELLRDSGEEFVFVHEPTLANGLEQLGKQRFDFVLLDLELPDSRGSQTVEQVRSACVGVPLIVLTGQDAAEAGRKSISHGAQEFLPKDNLDPDYLLMRMRMALQRVSVEGAIAEEKSRRSSKAVRGEVTRLLRSISGRSEQKPPPLPVREMAARLAVMSDCEDVDQIVGYLASTTRQLNRHNRRLEQRLDQTQAEIGRLNSALQDASRAAVSDHLTGLANRRAFDAYLSYAIEEARAGGRHLILMLADIDHFKAINDKWGHQAGDDVIRAVASIAEEVVGTKGLVARVGGEEFGIVLGHRSASRALKIATQLRNRCADKLIIPRDDGQVPIPVTISIGLAEFLGNETAETLLECADSALYRAKNSGRNRVESACTT